jgi:hypothetical protein
MNNKLQREPLSRPGEPTDAPPGSARKIRVLTERATRRESLFNPRDNLKRRLPDAPPEPELEEDLEPIGPEADEEEDDEIEMDVDLAG